MLTKPLNDIQRRIFNYTRLYRNDPSYNLTFLFVVEGPFDADRFRHISTQVADSADIARSRILMEDGHHVIVHDDQKMNNVRFINWEHLTRAQFLEDIRKIAETKLNTPIDVTKPLRINLELYKKAGDFHGIIVHFSHIVADAYGGIHFLSLVQDFYNSGKTYDEIATSLKSHSFGRFLSGDFPPIIKPHSPDFFRKEFQGLTSLEMLKIKQNRNSAGVVEGEGCTFKIDPLISKAIRDFVKAHEITEFPFFLAIYTILLARLSEQRDVVLGLPLANRTPANMNVFGCFVNTLPLRMTLAPDMTFLDLYKLAFQKTFAIMRHQGFDITTLDGGSRGFVNNVFTYYKQDIAFHFKECSVERIPLKNRFLMFDFVGRVSSGDCFTVNLEYGKPLADVNFRAIYHAILEQALANKKLGDIQLYTDLYEEYAETNSYKGKKDGGKQADDYADPDSFVRHNGHVAHVFQDIAEKYPDRTAIKFHQTEWSYKQLSDVSDGLAWIIAERFPQAKRIALSCPKGPRLVAMILGIIKSGKSYVPIDENSPARRIEYILADAGHIPYITEDDILDMEHRLSNSGSQDQQLVHRNQSPEPRDLANELYVIYTSGSTGDPKGVPVSSANLMSLLKASESKFDFNEQDIWTLFHSYGFDFSVWEIFGCLLSGGKLLVVDGTTAKSPEQFYELVSRENVTVLNQTPTAFRGFMNADTKFRLPLSLRYIIFGGEKLTFTMLSPWLEQHEPDAPYLINMYGITETTVHVTFYEITRNDILHNPRSMIGKPLNSMEVYIVDQDLNILPKGLAGELLVCGQGVVNGYHNKEDITRNKFIHLATVGQRAYRSGDIAKIAADGHLEYIGRMDNQVQLRGFRIELGEVENAILKEYQDYQIQSCTVQMIDVNGYDQLIAFIVSGRPLPDKKEIKQRLRNVLADYMIPLTYIQVDDLPMTVNGKIDLARLKGKLPECNELAQANVSGQNELFRNEQEQYLFDIFSRILNSKDFSLDDNFFDIGIMSIHIPDLYDSISATYKIDGFHMIDLFEYTTIRKLSALIRRKERTKEPKSETNSRAMLRRRSLESRGRGL